MATFEKKLVAVLNKNCDTGKVMNALAHMCIGFGAHLSANQLQLVDYQDRDDNVYPNISKMPFIILRTNGPKINTLRKAAIQQNIEYSVFTDTMTVGTWEEQLQRTLTSNEQDLVYMGIVLFGEWQTVSELTKKFSLWK